MSEGAANVRDLRVVERTIALVFAAPAIAAAAAFAAGGSDVLREPGFSFALLFVVVSALAALPYLVVLLVPTSLRRSLPRVAVVAVAAAAVGWRLLSILGFGLVFVAAVAAMLHARQRCRDVGVPRLAYDSVTCVLVVLTTIGVGVALTMLGWFGAVLAAGAGC